MSRVIWRFVLVSLLFVFSAHAKMNSQTSIQSGLEYDSNVLKTFGSPKKDFLGRFLLKNQGVANVTEATDFFWDYQGGGKKYFSHTEQDTLIQFLELKLNHKLSEKIKILFEPNFKYQNENNKLDSNSVDVNEDFFSHNSDLKFVIPVSNFVTFFPQLGFSYFHFYPNQNFSFLKESTSILVEYQTLKSIVFGLGYGFSKQQFEGSNREDSENRFSLFIQYQGLPFVSVGYSFEDSQSNLAQFSFNKHHFNFLLSWIISQNNLEVLNFKEKNDENSYFSFHLLASLQIREFPAVYNYALEGQRFLLTGEDDENFNSITAKVGYHFFKKWSLEGKYTRYSNELTSAANAFHRSLYYLGARYEF